MVDISCPEVERRKVHSQINVINLQKIWRFDDVKQTVEINLIIITNISRLSDNNKKNEA